MPRYEPHNIEPKWQDIWEQTGIFRATDAPTNKAYVLDMFPYPSGDGLHVGHPRGYTASDVYAHFMRYTGRQVLHPIGWDAFGLPAENAAIKKKVHPAENTAANIATFCRQLKRIGYSYDWSREINTSSPDYYRWTQWLFLKLFEKGLAYRAPGWQWWCPNDKTVLANEQVVEGKCERCGHEVTKKELTQWFFKITDYADQLVDDLDDLDWPDKIKAMQRNWIGKSEGAEIVFPTAAGDIAVYTTRPDTLFGATYLVLAPEHELVGALAGKKEAAAVRKYIEEAKRESDIARTATDKPKTGVFSGNYATNPATNEQIPIWIADYVLASYGTGAIMAVPAHDQRDREFAEQFDLPIRQVVMPETGRPVKGEESRQSIVAIVENPKNGKLLVMDWGENTKSAPWLFVGGGRDGDGPEKAARREIREEAGYTDLELVAADWQAVNHYVSIAKKKHRVSHAHLLHFRLSGETKVAPQLEDHEKGMFTPRWITKQQAEQITDPMHAFAFRALIKRESYDGEGTVINSGKYDGLSSAEARERITTDLTKRKQGRAATGYKLRDWLVSRQRYWGCPIPVVHCPQDGIVPLPENQLPVELPEVADYLPTGDGRSPLAKVKSFVETSCPKCGGPAERETDTMDTFVDSSWYFLRYASPQDNQQAFDRDAVKRWSPVDLYVGGAEHAVLHLIYARFITKVLADLGHLDFREPFTKLRNQGLVHADDGHKMSKSKGNVINPDEIIAALGADTLRVYELFIGPFDQKADWSVRTIEGVHRLMGRIWRFGQSVISDGGAQEPDVITRTALDKAVNDGVRQVTRSIEQFRFNTAVSALMETLNELYRLQAEHPDADLSSAFKNYLILLSPFAPHIAEELWQQLGHEESIFRQEWPVYDPALAAADTVTVAVQVNGKLRGDIAVPAEADEEAVAAEAMKLPTVAKHLAGQTVRKRIYVAGKVLNLVV